MILTRARHVYIACLAVALGLLVLILFGLNEQDPGVAPFDLKDWRAGTPSEQMEVLKRVQMSDHFINKSRSSVIAALGVPDRSVMEFHGIVEGLRDPVAVLDRAGRCVPVAYGNTPDSLVGKSRTQLIDQYGAPSEEYLYFEIAQTNEFIVALSSDRVAYVGFFVSGD